MTYATSDLSTWSESDKAKNLQIWRREVKSKTTLCLRNKCLFPGVPPEVAFTCITDVRVRKQWDTRIESWNIIE